MGKKETSVELAWKALENEGNNNYFYSGIFRVGTVRDHFQNLVSAIKAKNREDGAALKFYSICVKIKKEIENKQFGVLNLNKQLKRLRIFEVNLLGRSQVFKRKFATELKKIAEIAKNNPDDNEKGVILKIIKANINNKLTAAFKTKIWNEKLENKEKTTSTKTLKSIIEKLVEMLKAGSNPIVKTEQLDKIIGLLDALKGPEKSINKIKKVFSCVKDYCIPGSRKTLHPISS
ncbi:MAG: hypothetical protein RsTaC01_0034 [Candidatus Paraimprobicoccus trichonymphae]|uniref:Uncharacterized protein n=1 Tax=Candidatus Paraimprobicoccus trichonymphae TaxID=3033793 RepID=A0AA48I225_9FIRM|nr:MAG: hypothetical protein RsTaC01_0034 [Candidatus Paraimprobicoccus trichonymphae]